MPQPKKKVGVKKVTKAKPPLKTKQSPRAPNKKVITTPSKYQIAPGQHVEENTRFAVLVEIVRTSKDEFAENMAFNEIYEKLKPRIQMMISRFKIPGLDSNDILQECLIALRWKAIKDYDATRGTGEGPAPFAVFAMMCMRRHLSTESKSSTHNNRKKVLNQSISLDHENKGSEENLSLANIIPSTDGDILDSLQDQEYYRGLMGSLVKSLSRFEREVLGLYAQRFSYDEIAAKINEKRVKIKVNVKGVDNALSRIKHKGRLIIEEYERNNELFAPKPLGKGKLSRNASYEELN